MRLRKRTLLLALLYSCMYRSYAGGEFLYMMKVGYHLISTYLLNPKKDGL